jgi:signal transduction histidine kinase
VGTAAETVSLAQVGVGSRAVALQIGSQPAGPLTVRGNRERLIQVLTNIVLNATQATPDGGIVTVRTDQREGLAVVTVHNTGSYIPPQVRRQLFVPFFTTKPTGTGLGLAIARQIVMSMDGRIEVESDHQTGTTFTVELPLVMPEEVVAVRAG